MVEQHGRLDRLLQLRLRVHRRHDLDDVRPAPFELLQLVQNFRACQRLRHVRRHDDFRAAFMDFRDELLLLRDGGFIICPFAWRRIVQVSHDIDARRARLGGLQQDLLAGFVRRAGLPAVITIEKEHERQAGGSDNPLQRLHFPEFRLQMGQVDADAVRPVEFRAANLRDQLLRRLARHDRRDHRPFPFWRKCSLHNITSVFPWTFKRQRTWKT